MKLDITKIFYEVKDTVIQKSPEILLVLGLTGLVSAEFMVVKATPKALDIIAEIKEQELEKKEETKQIVVKTAPVYGPPIGVTLISLGCVIGAFVIKNKRFTALAALYSISESTLKEYQTKVIETIGPKKEKQIQNSINQDCVDNNPLSKNKVTIVDSGAETLFYDKPSGRYFKMDRHTLETKVQTNINKKLDSWYYLDANEWYDELNLPHVEDGDKKGFCKEQGFLDISEWYDYVSADNGDPCIMLDYQFYPKDYGNLH